MPSPCPKCGTSIQPEMSECPACGVIFAKIRHREPLIEHSGVEFDVLEVAEGLELVAIVSCEYCQKVTHFKGAILQPGASLFCPCGNLEAGLPVEGFDEMKASLAGLNASLANFTLSSSSDGEDEE